MTPRILLGDRNVGTGCPVYIVAELSANHRQDLDQALQLIREAKKAGADAIKLQTYTPDTITIDSDAPWFRIGENTLWEGKRLYQLYAEAYTPWDWHPRLQEEASRLGLHLFSTPFDVTAVDFLVHLGVPALKIASFEVVDLALIRYAAMTQKPILMSTGMATREEIGEAVKTIRETGNNQIALLKCTSSYPAPADEMNLRTIPDLARAFGVTVGLSDHTLGAEAPVAAVSLGASIIEKHFTLSRSMQGPDSAFSLEPPEFRRMVEAIRVTERALGTVAYGPTEHERASLSFRRSLFVVEDMEAGEIFTSGNVRSVRPGYGLPPKHLGEVMGRRAARRIARGTPLAWDLIA